MMEPSIDSLLLADYAEVINGKLYVNPSRKELDGLLSV